MKAVIWIESFAMVGWSWIVSFVAVLATFAKAKILSANMKAHVSRVLLLKGATSWFFYLGLLAKLRQFTTSADGSLRSDMGPFT